MNTERSVRYFDWQKFKSEKIAVRCINKFSNNNFTKEAEENGIEKQCTTLWEIFENETCYIYDDGLERVPLVYCTCEDYKMVDWYELLRQNRREIK